MSGMNLAPYQEFARERLGFEFTNLDLLVTALTHRSYVNEHKSVSEHNERLEFLGDAVLELVVTKYLYEHFTEPEGVLTAWRAALVRTESIGAAGEALGYGPLLRMSKGEKNGSERARLQMMANAFEAVIGAIYLERGFAAAQEVIAQYILSKLDAILASGSWRDPKSHLQELSQRIDNHTPVYKVLGEEGPDHDKVFRIGVFVGERLMGTGLGPSKQAGQQAAAERAIAAYQAQEAPR
ncbi:MAG: ribonuclease III [Candidatus Saccharibacteria bacterium]|nr:ribonuclease III [Candidatus Saccharibacteria bacterium]